MSKKQSTIKSAVSRRQFGTAAGVAAVAAGAPSLAMASDTAVTEGLVSVATANGPVDGFFVRPVKGKHPGVLSWRQEAGLGVTSRAQARRLAKQGYSVLVLDRDSADAPALEADAQGALTWLEKSASVDEKRGVGTPQWAEERLKPQLRY